MSFNFSALLFFDRPAVESAVDKATKKALSKFGSFVRKTARQSIRKRKRISREGEPPTNRLGTLKRFIFFAYEPDSKSVVIGPERLSKIGNAPQALEYGGRSMFFNKRIGKVVSSEIKEHPYMRPAFAENLPKAAACLRGEIK